MYSKFISKLRSLYIFGNKSEIKLCYLEVLTTWRVCSKIWLVLQILAKNWRVKWRGVI